MKPKAKGPNISPFYTVIPPFWPALSAAAEWTPSPQEVRLVLFPEDQPNQELIWNGGALHTARGRFLRRAIIMRLGLLSSALILLFAGNARAQWADRSSLDPRSSGAQTGFTVRGQIASDNTPLGSVIVELVTNGRGISQTTGLMGDGSFEFHYVTPGPYELRITGPGGGVIHQEHVIITGPQQYLNISMSAPQNAGRSGSGTVSIRQLQHRISPEALKEYERGQKAATKGDHLLALDHFRQAVNVDPEFADAYNYL